MSLLVVVVSLAALLPICLADIIAPTFTRCVSPGISTLPTNSVIRYVSASGSDSNAGDSLTTAWQTLSHAASTAASGTTVYVRGGTYTERVVFSHAGTSNAWIIFTNYGSETPVIDGSTLTVSSGKDGLVTFNSGTAYIALVGFEIRNFVTSSSSALPLGIWIASTGSTTIHDLLIRNNTIHNIKNFGTSSTTNAFGMAVYGQTATPISGITFDFNEVYDTVTGQSETVTFNGNVDGFVAAYNYIHSTNNIGLDAIGYEGTSSTNDYARNGIMYGNIVANITSNRNPTYAANSISADGIYVDGGQNILIDSNIVVAVDIGIEIASEHAGRGAINCTAQNNIVWGSHQTGISLGGYDSSRGWSQNISLLNNYLWNNNYDSAGTGEIQLQYDVRTTMISGNVLYDGDPSGSGAAVFISSSSTVDSGVTLQGNSYKAGSGLTPQWQWLTNSYSTLATWQAAIGSDTTSTLTTANVAAVCEVIGGQWQCSNAVPVPVCPAVSSATTTTTTAASSTTASSTSSSTSTTTTTTSTASTTASTTTKATTSTTPTIVTTASTTSTASTSSTATSTTTITAASDTTTNTTAVPEQKTMSSASSTTVNLAALIAVLFGALLRQM